MAMLRVRRGYVEGAAWLCRVRRGYVGCGVAIYKNLFIRKINKKSAGKGTKNINLKVY